MSDSRSRKEPAITRPRSRLPLARTVPAQTGRSRRGAALRLSALTAAAALVPALAAGPAHADPPGRVCMFLAPENVHGLGHVGWGYRHADGTLWDYGATSSENRPWHSTGTLPQMLADFRNRELPPDAYLFYRCRATDRADDPTAKLTAASADAEDYNLFTSNCLTRALRIFHAYDDSADLVSLGDGVFTPPRWYFDHDLDGFDPRARL